MEEPDLGELMDEDSTIQILEQVSENIENNFSQVENVARNATETKEPEDIAINSTSALEPQMSPPPPPLPLFALPSPRVTPPLPPLPEPDILSLESEKLYPDNNNQKEDKRIEEPNVQEKDTENNKSEEQEDAMLAIDDLDNDNQDSLFSIDDLNDSHNEEIKDVTDPDGEQKLIRARLVNTAELGCCEYCGGPVKKRRICSPLKKFCSKACARNCRKPKNEKEETIAETQPEDVTPGSSAVGSDGEHKMTWDDYLQAASNKAAPESCFKHSTTDVPGLKPGMKLEAVDRNNPPSYCVATVIKCVGHRVCIRYDGYGSDSSNDIWCNYQAEELHPIGWCAQNGYPLQPPKGVGSSLEAWRTFLTQTLTGALAAPQDLFKKSQEHFQPRVHGFEVGMKLEAIHPLRPSIICPATVTKSLGPYYFAVTPDYQHDLPPTTFCCHSDSPGIFPIGWCYRNGVELTYPANYSKKTFSWPKYLSICRATSAPSQLFKKVKAHKFRVGMKVEAVDLEQPAVICVATITNVIGRLLFLFFDGQSRFQFVDVESPDMYPIGWCKRTGHPLVTPFGVMPSNYDSKTKVAETEILYLPSFDEVMGRQAPSLPTATVAILPRKSSTRSEQEKEKEKEKAEKDDRKKDIESEEKSGESDISEDDSLASERFYHNKNQIFFNKGCCIGPLLDPDRVKLLPDATPPGKVSTVIRTGLEMVATAALDPEKVIDLMQEGCGVRVTIKHEGKLLKKAISRVDSRPKLERYLKRFCRRLICCEYFLSLKPVGQPCPDQCKADDQGNLQGPKGLKAKRSREYFEVKHLGFEKKKRGRRRRKSEILGVTPTHQGAMKNAVSEHGAPVPATSVLPSSIRNRQLAPAYHIQPNSSTLTRPAVATAALPGVQAPVVRYQGPGNVAVVRPNLPAVRPHGTTPIAPAQTPHIVIGSVHGNTPLTKQKEVLANGRTIIMTDAMGPHGTSKPRIVTNVSGQRFATSSSGGGTTITFGRAPPNVTVCLTATPPPLTRISDTVESISAANDMNTIIAQSSPSPKSCSNNFNMTPSCHGSHARGPPNVVVSSAPAMMASGGTVQLSETASGQYTVGNNPIGGVIRAPIVIPPQVKQETPPPPPLVHASKLPSGVRVLAPGTVLSPTKVSLVPSSFSHTVSHRGNLGHPRPIYKLASASQVASSPLPGHGQAARTVYIRPGSVGKSDTPISSGHKHIMPSYQSFSKRISPKPSVVMQCTPIDSISKSKALLPARHHTTVFQSIGQATRPLIAAKQQGVIHTIHHSSTNSPDNRSFRSHAISPPGKPSTVNSVTLEKVRAGIESKAAYMEYPPNNNAGKEIVQKDEKQCFDNGALEKGVVDEHGDDAEGVPKKRNLWWLNKRRKRKRSRLTYIKPKYRKKESENEVCDEVVLLGENDIKKEDPVQSDYVDYPDRPKRGRLSDLTDLVMRIEDDVEGVLPVGDDEDPDWDESIERKKTKQINKPKRKGFGRPRKDGGSELSSPTLSNPPSPYLSSISSVPNNTYSRRTSTKQPATVPCDSKSLEFKLDPAPPRRPTNVEHEESMSYKRKPGGSASYASDGCSSRGPARSTSSHPSPVSPESPSFKRPKRLVDVGVNTSLPGCSSGRSPDLPSNPITWSVDQVIQYVRSTDCSHYAVLFKEEEIDGQSLLMLSRDALMQFTPMKLGPTLKMCSYISQLRLRAK